MHLDAIIFDVGNTLGPWRFEHGTAFLKALKPTFEEALGPMPDFTHRAAAAHEHFKQERFHGTFKEVTCAEFVDAVAGPPAPPRLHQRVEVKAHEVFRDLFIIPARVKPLLERLAKRYRLGVLSNFFMTRPIVEALERAGIAEAFDHIEVSAMAGWMKPHPAPFETVREKLRAPMERTLMVGDDFWADIVGGHRAGLLTALTREHHVGPDSDARAPGIAADRILMSLDELEG